MNFSDQDMDEAIKWHLRLSDDDADWGAFTLWLEAKESHRQAYEFVAVHNREIDLCRADIAAAIPANDDDASPMGRRQSWVAGIAACLALLGVVSYLNPFSGPDEVVQIATGTGERRVIALAEGVNVNVAANSRLTITKGDIAQVSLQKGAAYFEAPADPAASFEIQVGDYQVRDIGTQFGVSRGSGVVTVTVADGAVALSTRKTSSLTIKAGRGIQIDEKNQRSRVFMVARDTVAGWRYGSLIYEKAPIHTVAADIERTIGFPIKLDPAVSDQSFSGILKIGDGSKLVSDFSQITGLKAEKRDDAIYFRSAP